MGEDAKGGVAEPASSEPLFVRSRFLFTEEDFKEYFVPAQIWLAEWSVRLSPIILVPLSLAALACVYFLVVDGASYDGMTRAVLVGIVLMAVAGVALATFEFRRHSRPDFDRMQGDIEVFFARLAKGHPAALYGYRGSLLEELRELRDVAAKMGMTKDDPSGGRQSRPLGVVLETRVYDDRIVSGANGEAVVSDYAKDVAWVIDSKRFLVVRNGSLVDAIIDKSSLEGVDPDELKRFIKRKGRGLDAVIERDVLKLPRKGQS